VAAAATAAPAANMPLLVEASALIISKTQKST
jgi:hypothetical protein